MSGQRPRKAFVLAAGYGTRMLPLSRDLPKPLMPLWGRPALAHLLHLLHDWGVREVAINVHHRADALIEFAAHQPVPSLRLTLVYEPTILGTGGALRHAAWFLNEDIFWLVNADIVADLDPEPFTRTFAQQRPLAVLWVDSERGPRTVEVREGWITRFDSLHPGAPGTFTFCGLHLLSSRILRYLPREGFAGIIPAYTRALRLGEKIAGVQVPDSFWADFGSPRQYVAAHADLLQAWRRRARGRRWVDPDLLRRAHQAKRNGVVLHGFAAIGSGVRLARGARIEDSILWNGAQLGPRARLCRVITGRDVSVNEPVPILAARGDHALTDEERSALSCFGWPAHEVTVLPLGPRGSARTFTRIRRARSSLILLRYDPARAENSLYVQHARFLRRLGLRVPAVLLDRPGHCLSLLEDAGDRTLGQVVCSASPRRVRLLYGKVLAQVRRLHAAGTRSAQRLRLALMPPFSTALYRQEHDLFVRHFLVPRIRLPSVQARLVRRELERVAHRLLLEPSVLIHRDLQSSNILIARGQPVFIDFQGMRFGPAAYDLASLLCDPYVELSPALQATLLDNYARDDRTAAVAEAFWWAAVQRLVQALGAFGRLSAQPGLESFADFIPPALRLLDRALAHLSDLPALTHLVRRLRALAGDPTTRTIDSSRKRMHIPG